MGSRILGVGHSNRGMDIFRELLQQHGIEQLVDIRRYPASRRHPQFGREQLGMSLREMGVGYSHEEELGGHREAGSNSANTAWRETAFRGYADHMDSAGFRGAILRVMERANRERIVVMCAEADPGNCHRQLLADALVVQGAEVVHIVSAEETRVHRLHASARVLGDGRIVYDGGQQLSLIGPALE
jgi:uncharacterized protein (DUF488 family)